jgi:hypothetical protein
VRGCGGAGVRGCGGAGVRRCGGAGERGCGGAEVRRCGTSKAVRGSIAVSTWHPLGDGQSGVSRRRRCVSALLPRHFRATSAPLPRHFRATSAPRTPHFRTSAPRPLIAGSMVRCRSGDAVAVRGSALSRDCSVGSNDFSKGTAEVAENAEGDQGESDLGRAHRNAHPIGEADVRSIRRIPSAVSASSAVSTELSRSLSEILRQAPGFRGFCLPAVVIMQNPRKQALCPGGPRPPFNPRRLSPTGS